MNTIQKPEKLIERIVKASFEKGEVGSDSFSGVGTIFAVCRRLNRNFIGLKSIPIKFKLTDVKIRKIETDQEYSLFDLTTKKDSVVLKV